MISTVGAIATMIISGSSEELDNETKIIRMIRVGGMKL